jgi:O-antigen/teichoic acid export membrane protein
MQMSFISLKKILGISRENQRTQYFLLSQLVSSLGSLILNLNIANEAKTPADFGEFSIVFLIYVFTLGIFRSITVSPLLFKESLRDAQPLDALKAGCINSIIFGFIIILLSVFVQGDVGLLLRILGIGIPGLLVQDSFRYYFFSLNRPRKSFALDLTWTSTFFITALLLETQTFIEIGIFGVFGIWCISVYLSIFVEVCWLSPSIFRARYLRWYRSCRPILKDSLLDYIVTYASTTILVVLFISKSSFEEVAGYRAAVALLSLGAIALAAFSISEVRFMASSELMGKAAAKLIFRKLIFGPLALIVILPLSFPSLQIRFPYLFFGDSWEEAKRFILPISASYVVASLATIPQVILQSTARIRLLRQINTVNFLITALLCSLTFEVAGLEGFVWLLVFSKSIALVLSAYLLHFRKQEGN